jgi:hypothetical protein
MWLAELWAHLSNVFSILLFQGSSLHTSDYLRKSLTIYTLTGSDLDDDTAPRQQTTWSKKPNSLGGGPRLVLPPWRLRYSVEKAQSTPPLALCGEHTDMGPIEDDPSLTIACQPEHIIDLPTCERINGFQNAKN